MATTRGLVPGLPLDSATTGSNGLSTIDLELIRILQADGRRSFVALGRDLGLPEKTARRRVTELLEQRIIQITAVTDPRVLGYHLTAMLGITLDGQQPRRTVVEQLVHSPHVDYAIGCTGRFDALVEVLCRDMDELITLVDEFVLPTNGVADVEILPYLQLHYQEPAWEAAQQRSAVIDRTRGELDATDRDIIAVLTEDGRASFTEVGTRLEISESQVRKRVGRLLEENAVRLTAIANPRTLGFTTVAWIGLKCASEHSVADLAKNVASLPSVTYVAITAGTFDLLAEVVCPALDDLLSIVDGEIRPLPGVRSTEMMLGHDLRYRAVQSRTESTDREATPHGSTISRRS